jgi:hypothetical protein
MAGRMILFAVICFLLYWGWQYYKNAQTNKEKPKNPADFRDSDGDPDALRAYYERKIVEMEERAVMGIENAQEELEKYQEKLKKLNNLKNK